MFKCSFTTTSVFFRIEMLVDRWARGPPPSLPRNSGVMTKHITMELIRPEQDENPNSEKHEIGIGSDLNTELEQ